MYSYDEIVALLESLAEPKYVEQYQYFFKTGPGQYGEGDKFLGIRNPNVRSVVKEAWKQTSLSAAEQLCRCEWHEVRLCGLLILVEKMLKASKRRDEYEMREIWQTYISLHPYINNWDLVDLSAVKLVGAWLKMHPEETLMDEWIRLDDEHLWQRRIAMVSTWQGTRQDNHQVVFERASLLMDSRHDLLHKVAGWMLREVYIHGGKEQLEEFLAENVVRMPAVMLSYACEKMSDDMRSYWRKKRRVLR